jgi:photosystem II stability/assembly factor-like uncharacterized protein
MAWLHAVYFLDQNRGWVAGSSGTLMQTNDGGQTWRKLHPPTEDTLRDVFFTTEQNGWLVCDRDVFKLKTNDEARSYLLRTNDGGLSWQRVSLPGFDVNARLVRAVFGDENHGWAFGESGAVFATRDGGVSWTRQSLPTKHLLLGGTFVDGAHGWLVGASGTILQTSDAGTTWHNGVVREGLNARFTAASFVSNRLGWAVGTGGALFVTSDGGRNWYAQRSNTSADLLDVKFVDAVEGWAAGAEGTLLHTTDGVHWMVMPSVTSHPLERLFFTDRDHGWAIGFGGTIISYSNSSAQHPQLRAESLKP